MRFAVRALMAGILMVCCRGSVADQTSSSWWPFGHHADAADAPLPSADQTTLAPAETNATSPGSAPSNVAGPVAHEVQMPSTQADANSDPRWMLNMPKKKVSWPKLHMPEMPKALSSKSASATKTEANKNRWAEKTPAAPKTSPMQSVKNGAHRFAASTKSAWHKTVAAVTPGDKAKTPAAANPPQVARRDASPPFWKKMFGAKESDLQQPQTVPQWMAQKRLDP